MYPGHSLNDMTYSTIGRQQFHQEYNLFLEEHAASLASPWLDGIKQTCVHIWKKTSDCNRMWVALHRPANVRRLNCGNSMRALISWTTLATIFRIKMSGRSRMWRSEHAHSLWAGVYFFFLLTFAFFVPSSLLSWPLTPPRESSTTQALARWGEHSVWRSREEERQKRPQEINGPE